jgi:hypothetical protein
MVVRAACLAALLLAVPAAARAVTVDDIVALSKAGVTADILVAVIDADQTMFNLTPEQIIALRKAGVPNEVVVKMIGTRREFVVHEDVPPPLIVGQGPPEREVDSAFMPAIIGIPFLAPLQFVPVVPVVPVPVAVRPARSPRTGFGRFINDGSIQGFGRFNVP